MNVFDDIKAYLPKYLSEQNIKALFENLADYTNRQDDRFFSHLSRNPNYVQQGDGVDNVLFANFLSEDFYRSKAVVLSNTCDIAVENKRIYDAHVSVSPIYSLLKWQQALNEAFPKEASRVKDHIAAIRRQEITSFFYIPDYGIGECFIRFDHIQSYEMSKFDTEDKLKERKFSLSNFGFYLLILKLSIHFSRVQEKIDRDIPDSKAS